MDVPPATVVSARTLQGVAEPAIRDPALDFVMTFAEALLQVSHRVAAAHPKQEHPRHGDERGASRRRRARILAILAELAPPESVDGLEDLLDDSDQGIRSKAVELFLDKGRPVPRRRAFRAAIELLQSSDGSVRADVERLLLTYLDVGSDLLGEEIEDRRLKGEVEEFWPRETPLAILLRIERKSKRGG